MVLTWSQWKKYSEKSYPETKIKLRHLDWVSHGMRVSQSFCLLCYWKLIRKKIVSLLFTIGFVWFVAISPAIPAKQSDSS